MNDGHYSNDYIDRIFERPLFLLFINTTHVFFFFLTFVFTNRKRAPLTAGCYRLTDRWMVCHNKMVACLLPIESKYEKEELHELGIFHFDRCICCLIALHSIFEILASCRSRASTELAQTLITHVAVRTSCYAYMCTSICKIKGYTRCLSALQSISVF